MALGKGLEPLQVVSIILFVRLLSVFVVQTWYVPDEYWQSLEVAHKQVFGYGELTWEWQKGIRSYLYPSLIAGLYYVLKFTGLDYPEAVVLVPRIFQAIVSTAADYSIYKWTGNRKWALFLILTSWFWFYTSGRTLIQTFETSLVAIGLSLFPFKSGILSQYEKESTAWMFVASVSVFVRPTSVALWAVLAAYNLLTTNQGRLQLVLRSYLPIGLSTAAALVGLDSWLHGSFLLTPWEFFRVNVLHDMASFYGQHPWHWYLWQGLPAVLGVHLVPVLAGAYSALRRPNEHRTNVVLLTAAAAHVALYSCIPHKEFRFLLPLLPLFLFVSQDVLVRWSRKAAKWQLYVAASLLLAGNAIPALYFGAVHQAGTTRIMPLLRSEITSNNTSVLFLMPCHSTPLYSHIHQNVSTRYLHCAPGADTYESEYFFNNPARWWRAEYSSRQPPAVILMFDRLKGRLENLLGPYTLLHSVAHTQFPEGEVGENVLLFKRTSITIEADAAA